MSPSNHVHDPVPSSAELVNVDPMLRGVDAACSPRMSRRPNCFINFARADSTLLFIADIYFEGSAPCELAAASFTR